MPKSRCRRKLSPTQRSVDRSASAVREKAASKRVSNLTKRGQEALWDRRYAEAASAFQTAIQGSPNTWQLYNLLGAALRGDQRLSDAVGAYENGLALRPDEPTLHNNLGNVLRDLGRYEESLHHLQEAIHLDPHYAEAHHNAALTLEQLQRTEEAEQHCARAVELKPEHVEALFGISRARLLRGCFEDAEASISRAIEVDPNRAELRLCQASILRRLGRYEEAERVTLEAAALAPDLPEVHLARGVETLARGDPTGARDFFRKAIVLRPELPAPYVNLLAAGGALSDGELSKALELAQRSDISRNVKTGFCFAVAEELDRRRQYDQAIYWAHKANKLERSRSHYNDAHARDFVQRSILTFEKGLFAEGAGSTSSRPVFIVGFPRSGTSLVEQIVASHPLVAGGGELSEIPNIIEALEGVYPDCVASLCQEMLQRLADRYLRGLDKVDGEATRVTDKLPFNFRNLGLIARLFPNAHVLHCQRDPRDVAISAYFIRFVRTVSFAQSFYDFGQYWRKYERLMEHWRASLPLEILDVDYDRLVTEPEREVARILDFLGVRWDDACLRFYENKRAVRTASVSQVRNPIHTRSIGRWRNYAKHLVPLYYELGHQEAAFEA